MSEYILTEQKGDVLTITLNRPEKVNALNQAAIKELFDIISDLRYDLDTKFLVIKANGKHFTGGADIKEIVSQHEAGEFTTASARKYQYLGLELLKKLETLEQITFAQIHGACVGGGLAIALACDFRILSNNAYFSIPEVERGLFFTWGSTARLINTVGVAKAKEMIILAEPVSAKEAKAMNLATRVVKRDDLESTTQGLIEKINKGPATPVRLTKRIAHAAGIGQIEHITEFDAEFFQESWQTGEAVEEINKFFEKK